VLTAQLYERDKEITLVKLRDMIFNLRDKAEHQGKKHMKAIARSVQWQGQPDMEEMCAIFTRYMTTPTVKTTEKIRQGILMEDGVTKVIKSPRE